MNTGKLSRITKTTLRFALRLCLVVPLLILANWLGWLQAALWLLEDGLYRLAGRVRRNLPLPVGPDIVQELDKP